MTYRIISDISSYMEEQETSFCIKIINGIVLTYTGRFKTWNPSTSLMEMAASAIGLSMLEDHVNMGDSIVVHSDTTQRRHARSKEFKDLNLVTKRLWKRGVHVHFIPTNGKKHKNNWSDYYLECHREARRRMRAKLQRYDNVEYNNQYNGSRIWDKQEIEKSVKIFSTTDTTY